MSNLNIVSTRKLLQEFNFHKLFIEELGWSQPASNKSLIHTIEDVTFICRQIAQLGGVAVVEAVIENGAIPGTVFRKALHKEIQKAHHENLIVFVDEQRTQSLWYWVKRESGKAFVREHYYFKGQPGDLFLAKISSIVIDMGDLDANGDIHVTEVINRLKNALDIERVVKKFYNEYKEQRIAFTELIKGIKDERDRKWYASIILNRLMFIYFLQKKGFVNNDLDYLQTKLVECQEKNGKNKYYANFMMTLFFEGFAKPAEERSKSVQTLLGEIKYLNGGLFLPHRIENEYPGIQIEDKAFEGLFGLFTKYSWNLDDTPGSNDGEMNPDVLGYIFEKYINQKAFGAYYTRPEITEYLSERTIYKLVLDRINTEGIPGSVAPVNFKTIPDMLMHLNADLCRQLLNDILPKLSILDPACGSGAFLVAAMKTLINIYAAAIAKIDFMNDRNLKAWLSDIRKKHPSINYYIKKKIITDNLYGVDIMEEATEIAKLRLFLALVASATSVEELEPLPNIDFNIMAGNSLIGLMHKPTNEEMAHAGVQQDMFKKDFTTLLAEKNRLVQQYRHATTYAEDLRSLKVEIEKRKKEAQSTMNEIMLDKFRSLGIKFMQATWDDKKGKEGKSEKRDLSIKDIERLKPFHWGYEFDEIVNKNGGFDAILTNPPWEIFKPNGKEFLEEFSDLITKKKMTIKEFEKEQEKLLKDKDVLKAWLTYLNEYPHVSEYYREAEQYRNQISVVNGKKAGTDINLYKLFTEQSFNLTKKNGECGIVIPSGIYTDLGTKRLREMLFEDTQITGLFCFENRKEIFENVDSRFKFVVITFKKGEVTKQFPARFMRHEVSELDSFPLDEDLRLSIDLIKKLSPDSLSVMEFKNELDVKIAKKMLKWPLLGEDVPGQWKLSLTREFDMTNDSHLFKTEPGKGRLPLYEGKMIWHYDHKLASPRYWVLEKEGRKAILGRSEEAGQTLHYQTYRIGFRDIARNTDTRTMIATILPSMVYVGNTINYGAIEFSSAKQKEGDCLLLQVSLLNSFVNDYFLRFKVTAHCNFFIVYSLPLPRLRVSEKWFPEIVTRTAQLICTTPEFDDLAKEVGLKSHKNGVTDPAERAKLRAELDGIIAHLYELTEDEFAYILTTFPLVPQPLKDAALEEYKKIAQSKGDPSLLAIIKSGESHTVEFKETARFDVRQNQPSKAMEKIVLETVAAFLNTDGGELIIGVSDTKEIIGLDRDFAVFGKKENLCDIYENWLMQYLLSHYGKDVAPCIKITLPIVEGKTVCHITISTAPRAVYIKEGNNEQFFIRTGNSKKQLSTSETVQYCKQKWA